jgi:DAK2 domain fusion protein YloV
MTTKQFINHINAASMALVARRDEVNKLNVFPVPDGDTGTNMSLTIDAVVKELNALPEGASLADMRRAVTHGSLMGARGNSGVITSQILRGICEGLEGATELDTDTVARALQKSREVAFNAVRKPVEGTILTVLSDVADCSLNCQQYGLPVDQTLQILAKEAMDSVNRTPELLPVLKENGVVDAGGYGLAILIEGFVNSVNGAAASAAPVPVLTVIAPQVAIEQINDWEGSQYLYCTEFLFNSADLEVEEAQSFLASMGDCELLVGAHPDFKVHVHTNDPGSVLSWMTARGQVSEVHIHNMRLQSQERTESLQTASFGQSPAMAVPVAVPDKSIGVIAIASGSGMQRILTSLGVDAIVSGGQTMNPSTKDILDAIEQVAAEAIIILPNNKNIILAAQAAADICERPAVVIPTISVPQSFAALFVADFDASLDDNVAAMSAAIEAVHSGEITHAVKNAKTADGLKIKKGDVIGLIDDDIKAVGKQITQVALELIAKMANDDADTLTILAGEDLVQSDFEVLLTEIAASFPDLEVDAHRGEQPLYPLVMSME